MRFLLFVLIAVVVCGNLSLVALADDDTTSESDVIVVPSARSRFVMPKLFDFKRFKEFFQKSYRSVMEELVRGKLYVARAFAAFISMVNYRTGKLSSYQSVNPMSDMTPAEREQLKISREQMMMGADELKILDLTQDEQERDDDKLEEEKLEEVEQVIDEVEKHKEEPGFEELAKELERLKGDSAHEKVRRKRDNFGNLKFGSFDGGEWLKNMVGNAAQALNNQKQATVSRKKVEDEDEEPKDVIYADHRRSGCLLTVRDQRKCGSCTVFAAIALHEYVYCRLTGKKLAFSEQYSMDCLDTFKCSGNFAGKIMVDITSIGFELRSDYPYRGEKHQCPYKEGTKKSQQGYVRIKDGKAMALSRPQFKSYLKKRPIVYTIYLDPSFRDYGGGVHLNENCAKDDNHAMLLVGYGREDGLDYFLFRNSHSIYWGEQGYYKMAASAMEKCGSDKDGYVTLATFDGDGINKDYAGAEMLREHYRQFQAAG